MHGQEACSKSTDMTAKRYNGGQYDRIEYRRFDGTAYYHNRIGEIRILEDYRVDGWNDWEPNKPKEATDE